MIAESELLAEHRVLDYGFVRLDDYMADDLSVVNSARVSFAQRSEEMTGKDKGLVGFLMRERHGTPFEHNAFRFHVKCPLFVVREWQRHRIGSFNEQSGRYSELDGEFYVPQTHDVRTQVGKPGSYTFEQFEPAKADMFREELEARSREAYRNYLWAIQMGVAKEQARFFLPLNLYTQMYWTVNARSLMNFVSLRHDPQAQWEIRVYAKLVEELASLAMPTTFAAFQSQERTAP